MDRAWVQPTNQEAPVAKTPIPADSGQQPLDLSQSFDLSMTDDALVTFGAPVGPGALSFVDVGYMPVNALTVGGGVVDLKGKLDGLFVHYSATGVQHLSATGIPTTADYTSLQYELVGYKGDATFTHATDGTPTLAGAKHLTVLAQGSLLPGMGHLVSGPDGSITGDVNTSLQVNGQVAGTLDFSVQHAAGDLGPAANGFTLSAGTLHATFVPLAVG